MLCYADLMFYYVDKPHSEASQWLQFAEKSELKYAEISDCADFLRSITNTPETTAGARVYLLTY